MVSLKDPETARKYLFAKGYVCLRQNSYMQWVLKDWHIFFLQSNLIRRKYDGSYVVYEDKLKQYAQWLALYDAYLDWKGFGKELSEYQLKVIDTAGLLPHPQQLSAIA